MSPAHTRHETLATAPATALIGYRQYKLPMVTAAFDDAAAATDRLRQACAKVAKRLAVEFDQGSHRGIRTREIAFYDTPEFALRNAGFIVRTRASLDGSARARGFELAVRFRNADPEAAAAVDMHPLLPCVCAMKFKQEILPANGDGGSERTLYANDCILESPNGILVRRLEALVRVFPALEPVARACCGADGELVRVNDRLVEERLLRLGRLQFGPKIACTPSLAIWRDRATGRDLIVEFSYQLKFGHLAGLPRKAGDAAAALFTGMCAELGAWVEPEATKTARVYAVHTGTGRA